MIGEIINDKYKIESVFSESYMYEIFTAIEAATGQTVVLKLMKEEMAVNAERVRAFSEKFRKPFTSKYSRNSRFRYVRRSSLCSFASY